MQTMPTKVDTGLRFQATAIAGVFVIERIQRGDERGLFERLFEASLLKECGWDGPIVQVNHSYTKDHGVVRGLHYQLPPYSEHKLVSCLRGEVWDVAVDLRVGSPTYLQHVAVSLSGSNAKALLIPPGCAHGFQTMSEDVDMLYCHSKPYSPEFEAGVNVCDPKLQIAWPLTMTQRSPRDTDFPYIADDFKGV